MTDHYAVIGNPIHHSKSPLIHALFAKQTDQDMDYTAVLAPLDDFVGTVNSLRSKTSKGCNVTVPFKLEAYALATQLSERAQRAEAVNTLVFHGDGQITGDNTDGIGLVNDLTQNHGIDLRAKRILVLGAGGAVRGIIAPLLAQTPSELVIANRTPEKAVAIAQAMSELGTTHGTSLAEAAHQTFDVIINGTSAGLTSELPELPKHLLANAGVAYDLVYGVTDTPFVRWAKAHGASVALDGLGMLVEQAAEAFTLWRGVRPSTASVIHAMRQHTRE